MDVLSFDPILILSFISMQVGAKYLDLELTDFQKRLLKNNIIQALILFGIIYIPVRSLPKTIFIVFLIYFTIYVLFNENHKYNIFSKRWLFNEGVIKEYNDIKNKYYDKISKIK